MKRVSDLPHDALALAQLNPMMADVLLSSLARLTLEDLFKAVNQNSTYRELCAVQWAVTAAHRAREIYPELKDAEERKTGD